MPAVPHTRPRATILFLFAAMALCAGDRASHAQPASNLVMYEATARFEIRAGDSIAPGSGGAIQSLRPLLSYHIKGRPALEQLALDLNLSEGMPRTPEGKLTTDGKLAFHEMMMVLYRGIVVKTEVNDPHAQLIAVTVRHSDRERAVQIANRLVENYIGKARVANDDRLLARRKFLSTETERHERKRDDLEGALARIRAQWDLHFVSNDENFPDAATIESAVAKLKDQAGRPERIKQRLARLNELTKDRPISDSIVLEILRLEDQMHDARQMAVVAEARMESVQTLQRDQLKMRQDFVRLSALLEETKQNLEYFRELMRVTSLALTADIGGQGVSFQFSERADVALPLP